jgi:hypothetical protein
VLFSNSQVVVVGLLVKKEKKKVHSNERDVGKNFLQTWEGQSSFTP